MPRHCRYLFPALIAACLIPFSLSAYSTAAAQSNEIPILTYHRFDAAKADATTVRTSVFEAQLAWLDEHHYKILSLPSALDALREGHPPLAAPSVAITLDDGHRSVYTEMFPVIRRHNTPVTLFIYPSAISNASYALTWEQLRTMQQSGLVDVQSHTYWHPNFRRERARLTTAEYQAFVAFQLQRSKDVLSKRLGVSIEMLAWPYGIHGSRTRISGSAGWLQSGLYIFRWSRASGVRLVCHCENSRHRHRSRSALWRAAD
jgi:peptidoglycan/xylan/chitin deacetylase (PgdA/CDA1 family)